MGYPAWSRDSRFIYFLRIISGDRGVYRIRAGEGKAERVADLKDWQMTGYFSAWMALDPTDAPLLLRDSEATISMPSRSKRSKSVWLHCRRHEFLADE